MEEKKSLVLYFSRADENYNVGYISKGNTEIVAEYIADITGADMFKVERKIPYAKDYNTCIKEAQDEKNTGMMPELKERLESISDYDVIYIGSPVYWGGMPMPLINQLTSLNFKGKKVRVFVTHEGSGLSTIPLQAREYCVGADVDMNGLAIVGSKAKESKKEVKAWLEGE